MQEGSLTIQTYNIEFVLMYLNTWQLIGYLTVTSEPDAV